MLECDGRKEKKRRKKKNVEIDHGDVETFPVLNVACWFCSHHFCSCPGSNRYVVHVYKTFII
jgi:hypothetical protein